MKLNVTENNTPAIVLFSAICAHAEKEGRGIIDNVIPDMGSVVDVKLTVNGIEIPFVSTINEMWRQVNDDVDQKALKKAEDIVKGAGFEQLFEVIKRAEWEVEQALNKALSELKAR